MEKFIDWLTRKEAEKKEACTDTGDVAVFARRVGSSSRRMYPEPVVIGEKKKKKEHKP